MSPSTPGAIASFAVALALGASPAWAQHAHPPASATPASAAAPATTPAAAAPMTSGEVRGLDVAAGKIILRHGDLPHLDMGPMTMVFAMREPAALSTLKVGDKVRFAAERRNGVITVTRIEKID